MEFKASAKCECGSLISWERDGAPDKVVFCDNCGERAGTNQEINDIVDAQISKAATEQVAKDIKR